KFREEEKDGNKAPWGASCISERRSRGPAATTFRGIHTMKKLLALLTAFSLTILVGCSGDKKTETKTEIKTAMKTEVKTEAKTDTAKTEIKTEVKTEAKTETKTDAPKTEVKTEKKTEAPKTEAPKTEKKPTP